jgi:putative ABC transport system permease protein
VTWDLALRQLLFRWRQHLLAVLGTALVFSTALLATGMSAGFHAEANQIVRAIGGNGWVTSAGTAGPFSGEVPLHTTDLGRISAAPGVRRAQPILILNESVRRGAQFIDVAIFGHLPGTTEPRVADGRPDQGPGEAVVDRSTGIPLGGTVALDGRTLRVVGRTAGLTVLGGTPTMFMALPDAQVVGAGGDLLMTAAVVTGKPADLPADLHYLDRRHLAAALLRPLRTAQGAIGASRFLLWAVAVVIVACVTYITASEQIRDFAVLKAVGAEPGALARGLGAQTLVVTLIAAVLAIGFARVMRPGLGSFPVSFTGASDGLLPVVAIAVGLLASTAGIRRALRTDPAVAFAGAA